MSSEECHTHLVSLIKHHGLFVPYIVVIFFFKFDNLGLALHTRHRIQGYFSLAQDVTRSKVPLFALIWYR